MTAAVLLSILKQYPSTTRLMGPPPMPRKLEMMPSSTPTATQNTFARNCRVVILLLATVYSRVPTVIRARIAA